jgi:site-specific DNA-methyltransferase (adenine-specific)
MILKDERIGNQRLILGDCLHVMPTLGRFDAVVTDPPYGIGYSPGSGGGGITDSNGKRYEKRFTGKDLVIGDDRPFDPEPILAMGLPTIMWGGNHFASRLPDSKAWLIWDKRRGTTVNDFADVEIAWSNLKTPARCLPHLWNGMLRDSERACQRMGRAGTGIELDPDYFDIACRRVDEAARRPDLLIPETRAAPVQEQLF